MINRNAVRRLVESNILDTNDNNTQSKSAKDFAILQDFWEKLETVERFIWVLKKAQEDLMKWQEK